MTRSGRAAAAGVRAVGFALFFAVMPGLSDARSIWVDALFAHPVLQQVTLNPSGTLIAARAFHEETNGLLVQTVSTGMTDAIGRAAEEAWYWWEDDDTLIVGTPNDFYTVFELKGRKPGERAEAHSVHLSGYLVDALPLLPDLVLWAQSTREESLAYRIPV